MNEKHNNLIMYLGENIFPQKLISMLDKFNITDFVYCIENNLIVKSKSKIGLSVHSMMNPKGYIELTDYGWEYYKKILI